MTTTAEVMYARLTGQPISEAEAQIPFMEEHGFKAEHNQRGDLGFRRGNLYVWQIITSKSGILMWHTARLKAGYFQEHLPIDTLENVVRLFKP